jgi:hypothetical protein
VTKVGQRFSLPLVETAFDLMDKKVAAPPMFYGLACIPQPLFIAFQGFDEFHVMAPGQMCNKLLHDLPVGERLSKGAHVFEVSWRKPRHFREIAPKVRCEPIDDAAAPALNVLARQNLAADAPIEQNKFSVDSNGCFEAR